MPEINLRVKVIGGKRTPLKVIATSVAVNRKTITLKSGVTISSEELESIINNAIIKLKGE